MTREEAMAKAKSGWWKDASDEEIVRFQLYETKLCMDLPAFHGAVERVLGRPVFTHEFVDFGRLQAEFEAKPINPWLAIAKEMKR